MLKWACSAKESCQWYLTWTYSNNSWHWRVSCSNFLTSTLLTNKSSKNFNRWRGSVVGRSNPGPSCSTVEAHLLHHHGGRVLPSGRWSIMNLSKRLSKKQPSWVKIFSNILKNSFKKQIWNQSYHFKSNLYKEREKYRHQRIWNSRQGGVKNLKVVNQWKMITKKM